MRKYTPIQANVLTLPRAQETRRNQKNETKIPVSLFSTHFYFNLPKERKGVLVVLRRSSCRFGRCSGKNSKSDEPRFLWGETPFLSLLSILSNEEWGFVSPQSTHSFDYSSTDDDDYSRRQRDSFVIFWWNMDLPVILLLYFVRGQEEQRNREESS